MSEVQETPSLPVSGARSCELQLLVATEPWARTFGQNALGLFRSSAHAHSGESLPGKFWNDVFVDPVLPWKSFLQSVACHLALVAVIWAGARFLASQPRVTVATSFHPSEVIYYAPSENLPPLDTRISNSAAASKADPDSSLQPIISLPREARNHTQTIVAAPKVVLNEDLSLPNIVALAGKANQRMPIAPAPVVLAAEISRTTPSIERQVIAPPPDLQGKSRRLSSTQAAVIAPPPDVAAQTSFRLGDIAIARSSVIAPAPQLPIQAQQTPAPRTPPAAGRAAVIAPPPAAASGQSLARENFVALSLHPAVGPPSAPPAGNRLGAFAATPEGHRGASGAPGSSSAENSAGAAANGKGKSCGNASGTGPQNLPSGLYVGKAETNSSPVSGEAAKFDAYSVNPNLIADVRRPKLADGRLPQESDADLSPEERAVFGSRRFYSLSLNMPNLNSAGGSWVIRFAALKTETGAGSTPPALSSPVAVNKVDPAYPLELMRQNLSGTVILYGVIRADGTVGDVRILRSIDDRLDQYASEAIAKWKFSPATRNGHAVDVEATFWIPFRPGRSASNF